MATVRTCGRDVLGDKVLDEVERVRDQRADDADRADGAAGIAAAHCSLARQVGEGQDGYIGRVGGRQPVDASLELFVGREEAALVAAHRHIFSLANHTSLI